MTCKLQNSRKSKFATEPSDVHYRTAETVCELWPLVASSPPDFQVTVM